MSSQIMIIGAGAAGLIAAMNLAEAGYPVTLLEAAPIAGGRIYSILAPGVAEHLEAGAEFVHGDLPNTIRLARAAGLRLIPTDHLQMTDDRSSFGEASHWEDMLSAMGRIEQDVPVGVFLSEHFAGEKYARLRDSVWRFASGYDLADPAIASTKALFAEWSGESESSEYRVEGGYSRLVDWLTGECRRLGVIFHFSTPVSAVRWDERKVAVETVPGREFFASAIIVTVAPPALKSLEFSPALPVYANAIRGIGWGSVIKALLVFRNAWWRNEPDDKTIFVLSHEAVPTWWTQREASSTLLTGWITGGNMREFRAVAEKDRPDSCLGSLSAIFKKNISFLREQLVACRIVDWAEQPFVHGGYSYDIVGTPACRRQLQSPVADTIYFAGEAVDEGPSPGTVEAAFRSGIHAAEKIIARHKK